MWYRSTNTTRQQRSSTTTANASNDMPKNKTHSGTKKRVKVTGTGKLMHAGSGKRHNLEGKPTSRTRHPRAMTGREVVR